MRNIVDIIHENMKTHLEYSFLSLDRQAEFCIELAELINNYFGEIDRS